MPERVQCKSILRSVRPANGLGIFSSAHGVARMCHQRWVLRYSPFHMKHCLLPDLDAAGISASSFIRPLGDGCDSDHASMLVPEFLLVIPSRPGAVLCRKEQQPAAWAEECRESRRTAWPCVSLLQHQKATQAVKVREPLP
jgi:hypothetical protein